MSSKYFDISVNKLHSELLKPLIVHLWNDINILERKEVKWELPGVCFYTYFIDLISMYVIMAYKIKLAIVIPSKIMFSLC